MGPRATAALTLALLALAASGCGGEDEGEPRSSAASGCEQVEAPPPRQVQLRKPRLVAPPPGTRAVVDTSCGAFTIALDSRRAPKTTASFAFMAERGLYDGTSFHRVAPGFVIQGGDPLGNGEGGPGYFVDERPPEDLVYSRGLVAMAKTQAEPPGRSGSQFFIVTAPADAGLPPDYALLGRVSDGMDTAERIERLGAPGGDGPPSVPVVIRSVAVERG